MVKIWGARKASTSILFLLISEICFLWNICYWNILIYFFSKFFDVTKRKLKMPKKPLGNSHNCPRCGRLLRRTLVLSAMASRRASGLTSPAGRATESKSATLISGKRTQRITRSSTSVFALHQAHTPRKISTSGAKNESRSSSSTNELCNTQSRWNLTMRSMDSTLPVTIAGMIRWLRFPRRVCQENCDTRPPIFPIQKGGPCPKLRIHFWGLKVAAKCRKSPSPSPEIHIGGPDPRCRG